MKITLIGYGKMGKTIEQIAISRGHEVACVIDLSQDEKFESDEFKNSDVAIEFTTPASAFANYERCFKYNVPVVSGTTGWLDRLCDIETACDNGKTFFYASNFSVGVNAFFAVNRYLAKVMNMLEGYDVKMEEVHHTQKLDAPSGTAISLAEQIIDRYDQKLDWVIEKEASEKEIAIDCVREGDVPGIHEVTYESEVDFIKIKHSAKTRHGFALGAVLAAEFTKDKTGLLSMEDMLKF